MSLGRTPWLFVIASTSTASYRGHAVDARQVGADLGVRYPKEREEEFRAAIREMYDRYYGASLADERARDASRRLNLGDRV